MKLTELAIDTKTEVEGVWMDYPGYPGVRLRTARAWNPEFDAEFARLIGEWRENNPGTEDIPEEDQEDIIFLCTVRKAFIDWEGIEDEKGEPIVYSPEVGEEVFRQDEYKHLLAFWSRMTLRRESFRAKALVTAGKKSRTSSRGKSGGAASNGTSRRGMRKTATLAN